MVLVPQTQVIDLKDHDQTQIQTIELCMLKKQIDPKLDSEMCNHERDLINNNKNDKTTNKLVLGFSH